MAAEPAAHAACATAPGKIILLGEHAVVYGRTALAAAINRHVEVRVAAAAGPACFAELPPDGQVPHAQLTQALQRAAEIVGLKPAGFSATIRADLPIGVGLGSSAALSVALVRALTRFAGRTDSDATVCARAFELEKIFHGFPSGIDNTVATYGGLIAFKRDSMVRPVQTAQPIPLVIALGRAPRQTQKTVGALRRKWAVGPDLYESIFDEIAELVADAERAIDAADLRTLGALMNANQAWLRKLGVSTEELDHLVTVAGDSGAFGAKLTGGGGGGAIICVGDTERLLGAFTRAGWRAFATRIGTRGAHATDRTGHNARHTDARA